METQVSIWHQEQKTKDITEYYGIIRDGEKTISFVLTHDATVNGVTANPYLPPDINYTVHDGCDHQDDYCVLEDPSSGEYQDAEMASRHHRAVQLLERQVKQAKIAEALLQKKKELGQ